MSKLATIKDVAREANVSIATVSRVVNKTGTVNSQLTLQVEAAIEKLHYSPNNVARSLKTSSTSTIAFLVSNISDPFFITIGRGIEDYIKDFNYNLIVCSTDQSPEKELEYLRLLKERQIDGLIINSTGLNNDEITNMSHQMPIVLSNRKITRPNFIGDFVDNDNTGGIIALTKHLTKLGHRKIGVLNGPHHLSTAAERMRGFEIEMKRVGIIIDETYPYLYEDFFTKESGYQGAKYFMELPQPPTAIIAMSSEIALGALKYCHSNHISIPNDVSLVAFGNIENSELLYINLTIANTNLKGIGNKMAELLIERIQEKGKLPNREIRFVTSVSIGDSTTAPPLS